MNDVLPIISYKILSTNFDDIDDHVYEIEGKVFEYDKNEEKKKVAKFRHFFVDLESSKANVFDLLDIRAETAPFIELYDSHASQFCSTVLETLDDAIWSVNLLILDRIEVLPEYRGKGLANLIINEAIKIFTARTEVVALKSFPLQLEPGNDERPQTKWAKSMGFQNLEQDEERAKMKLSSFYTELEFLAVGEQGLMAKRIA